MRWMTSLSKLPCRRSTNDDQGSSAILVGLLMTMLLAIVALVIDVGLIYAERTQLQNGADSGAVSVALSCAANLNSTNCDPLSPEASRLVDENSLDGLSQVADLSINKTAGTVRIMTVPKEAGREVGSISLTFARVLGLQESAVEAEAAAVWGNPIKGAPPFPVVFSECEIQATSSLQLVQFRKQGDFASACPGGPPGGFGNLDQVGGQCEALVTISDGASGNSTPGNGIPANCTNLLTYWGSSIESGIYPVGLFPVYKSVSESGSKAVYSLSGFAAFEIHGWKLKQGGSEKYPELFRADYYSGLKCDKDCIGIIGKFIRHVSLDEDFVLGTGGKDMGAYIVRLTE